ncbi:ABC transporter substrate-binding protein [Lactobacillus sp. LC28-10]|uniref:ABC transporter substrate-binding protein n=1 Tax=Secundilactobacillus angelensis TaxID=2722706 RepID=A0ABX1KXC3_9LACO|nr:ABC transporter substrate-binding protein [Secundilactobacillus angelensis]MCH5461592.1 ABC transporter substrate-binding protein [Secundilactobacillus angelensis]NLR17887.1 ABC transporter substrate-binding protein [Secundilactobacillus angelensis]
MKQIKSIISGAVIAMVGMLVLAGCGSTSKSNASKEVTRTVTVNKRQIKIPVHPKRIVTNVYTGDVLSLGGHVVGATSTDLASPFLTQQQTSGIKNLGLTLKPEAVLKLKPDLIVTSNEADVKALKKIAPVVYVPYGTTGNIKQTATKFGGILNRQQQAKSWNQKFEQLAAKQDARLKKAGIDPANTSVGMYDLQNGKLFVDGSTWGRGGQALTTGLGFQLPKNIQQISNGAGYQQVSLESLNKYSADWLFFTNTTQTKKGEAAVSDLKSNTVWKSLPAVKAEHVVSLPFNKMYYFDPTAVYQQMTLITNQMIVQAH